ncbi:hypothetical protein ACFVTE_15665 [Arthrobacter sp. NPDC058097]
MTSAAADTPPLASTNQPSGDCRSHSAPSSSNARDPAMKYITAPA